ncbi:MAG: ubiquinol-cytochrome c reductase iron-sulfur subunit [Bacteroidales bacterium]|nr:ubiquinol-cytochrome c reductase iron-sulfur subunit [Bacteroidales bacterium]MDT8374430.1 ubiquinol-cytochrome c reductase iron-sulfur subunit [Bacteroidales bacterium]
MKKRPAAYQKEPGGERGNFHRPGERKRTSPGQEDGRIYVNKPEEGGINSPRPEEGRRNFLRRAWKILGLVAVAELFIFLVSLLKPSREAGSSEPGATLRVIGNIEDFPSGTMTPDRINKLYIIREKEGGFLALSIVCPHLGCSVLWDETKKQFDCPCHSSAFDRQGVVLSSPAPRPLDYFPVIIEEGKVKVDISRQTKRKRFEQEQVTYAV